MSLDSGYPYSYGDQGYVYGLPQKRGRLMSPDMPKDGNRSWEVTTQPAIEPITVDELKTFARIDTTSEDTLLEGFITATRMSTEEYIGQAFISQTITTVMDFWPGRIVKLPRPPLISVTEVVALDEDDVETEYDSDNYYLNTIAQPGQLILKRSVTSPQNTTRDWSRFLIRSVHGYGVAATDVPDLIKEGIKQWAAALYADRTVDSKNPPPDARKFFDLIRKPQVMIR